jgi:hypothetical protein
VSSVGDAEGLNAEEGFELLSMVEDLPDPEDAKFLDEEFNKLADASKNKKITFGKFLAWNDVQDMLNEKVLSNQEVIDIWNGIVGGPDELCDRRLFGIINNALDDKIEENESKSSSDGDDDGDGGMMELTAADVWSTTFNPDTVFDKGKPCRVVYSLI